MDVWYDFSGVDPYGEQHTAESGSYQTPQGGLVEDYVCEVSGYEVVHPSSGAPYCQLVDVNLRDCPTDVKPDKERGCPKDGATEGNPCSVATGNKFQIEVDYEGHPDSHLKYTRYYNSDTTTPLGSHAKQWLGTFDRRLLLSTDPAYGSKHNGALTIFMVRHDGRVIQFIDGTPIVPKDSATRERLTKVDALNWTFTDADGNVESYQAHTGTAARLTSIRFVDGRRTNIAYNYNGYLSTVSDEFGHKLTFTYNAAGRITKFTDPANKAHTNRVEGGVDEDVSYDANGYVASRLDRKGVETTYVHDARGLETSRTEAVGTPRARTIATQWHATLRAPTLITESNRSTAYTYNALGNVLTKTVTDTLLAQSRTWTVARQSG